MSNKKRWLRRFDLVAVLKEKTIFIIDGPGTGHQYVQTLSFSNKSILIVGVNRADQAFPPGAATSNHADHARCHDASKWMLGTASNAEVG